MPRPKKAEKQKKEEVVLDLRQDREEFLKAFEKPTQIYRFLRARHCISPIFLHRSLVYMLERCSRNNSRRKVFRVNDLLLRSQALHSNLKQPQLCQNDQLTIVITGFFIDPGVSHENTFEKKLSEVDAEIALRKTYRSRRKDGGSLQEEQRLGTVEVSVNPRNPESYVNESIQLNTATLFQSVEGQSVKNYSLVFRVYESNDEVSDSSSESSDSEQSDSESTKCSLNGDGRKRKLKDDPAGISLKNLKSGSRRNQNLSDEDCKSDDEVAKSADPLLKSKKSCDRSKMAIYEAELDIFTSDRRTVLVDGEYDLSLIKKQMRSEGRKNATWEALDGGREIKVLSTMTSAPLLKFSLTWSESDKPGPLADLSNNESNSATGEPETKRLRRKSSAKVEDENTNTDNQQTDDIPALPVDAVEYRKAERRSMKRVNGGDANGLLEGSPVVYYQFIYNNESQQQTEARDDLHCPWCHLNCMTLYGLIKHLKLTHPRFHFTYTSHNQGCCIEVSVNECYDGSFCGNPQFIYSQPGMAFSRRGPVRRTPVTDTLYFRSENDRRLTKIDPHELLEKEENEAPPAAHYAAGHHRLYFHSDTNIPIRPCEFDVDSEEEPDPDWLKDHIRKMLDEFTDVNDGEKPIMKLWNLYIMKNSCIADGQMGESCRAFLDAHGSTIHRLNLRRNLLLHLVTLVDFGVLKTSVLLSLMRHFDKIADRETNSAHKTSRIREVLSRKKSSDPPSVDLDSSDRSFRLKRLREIIDSAQSDNDA